MSVKWEKQEGNEGVLTVTVPAEEVNAGLDKAFKKVVKQVNVPGFRKGKMPRPMFEQRFGVEALYQDALDFILPDAYAAAVEEAGINPVDRPEIDIEQMEKGKELIFTAKVTVEPEVELGDYKGLEVEKEDTEVTEEDLNKAIEADLARKAELVVKEEGEVAEGDVVNLDFDGYVNEEAFEGGKAEGYDLEIGSGQFIPGFEEQLVGTKVGDEKDVTVTFPEEYHAEELAGKEAVFKVKINEVKSKEVPELDDEMAKELDESVDSVDAYKEKYKKDLQEQKTLQAENNMKESLIAQAVENAKVDIPEAMINTELDRMMQEFEQRIAQQGLNLELYYQFSGQTEEQLKESMKADAEARVKTNLTLAAIAKAENIEISDTDVDAELSKMSEQFGLSVDDIKAALGNGEVLKDDLRIQKAIDVLVKESKEK
ncbi:trigger factor [Macrococcoides caseolyticum]|uniref:Trigger factor n=3 Tax=Bacilli TaxID=91061 RepID=TIG_MACCJ|nr:trigger factor [Macrococcus caseolyticus]B9E748.1 RecName: Full=Trigger factor; Short=TF; AltName: Full=PPIase [Macrococcus caseolyticus JCSC5402]MBQ5151986.1 trigger factor [Macrococcus caseolyticus]PKE19129.1 trigger factor [Macrococcus caseolyticus]PKE40516.1 trigger factor [Macrococcus caseolyticus]PKE55864.1 trigger factor [Macrococcus caseolyticus]PKF41637.1 trigger factor [Macrococcus caseolyticus]